MPPAKTRKAARARAHAGDAHNFGRRVVVGAKRVEKPRTLRWEWLVLARESPLRRALARLAREEGLGREAFEFLPALAFFPARAGRAGAVERVSLRPLRVASAAARSELAVIVGRALALFSWLGVADLHWENLALGQDARGLIVFTPLDVELILADLALPTETKLLPDADPEYAAVSRHACGVRRVLPYLGKPVAPALLLAMLAAYRETLAALDRHAPALAAAFLRLPDLEAIPIRVCLRGTDEYVRAQREPIWPPLLEAEAEQLARGDIPYFFRLYGRPGIQRYTNQALTETRRLPLRGDLPKLEPLLSLARGLRSPSRKTLRDEGLFTLLGAFDHPSFAGPYRSEKLAVDFGARRLVVQLASGEELESRRNLRAFVGSAYVPCSCGEVRSVFVPPVTRCVYSPDRADLLDL